MWCRGPGAGAGPGAGPLERDRTLGRDCPVRTRNWAGTGLLVDHMNVTVVASQVPLAVPLPANWPTDAGIW